MDFSRGVTCYIVYPTGQVSIKLNLVFLHVLRNEILRMGTNKMNKKLYSLYFVGRMNKTLFLGSKVARACGALSDEYIAAVAKKGNYIYMYPSRRDQCLSILSRTVVNLCNKKRNIA